MFEADQPIEKATQDRLGRATFSKYLARCILDHIGNASLAVGLYGDAGVGKTSILNLVAEELQNASDNMFDDEKPIILRLNAWEYSGQNLLVHHVADRINYALTHAPQLKEKTQLLSFFKSYAAYFNDEHDNKDIAEIKAKLFDLFHQQLFKVIILIDNVSQLQDEEVKQLLQLVKSIYDFPNTIYLLVMEEKHIRRLFNEQQPELLEKIIQMSFQVPPITQQDLEKILLDKLNHLVDNINHHLWDSQYWLEMYGNYLKHFFRNVRDICRYTNAISFEFLRVKDVVNPVDFFIITALAIFSPEVYAGVRENKDLFTDLMEDVYTINSQRAEEDKRRCDEIINRSEKEYRDVIKHLLIHLFPRLQHFYSVSKFYHSEALARKNLRICSNEVFDIYFRLSIPAGAIPDSEMNAIVVMTNDIVGFDLAIGGLNQDGRIIMFLEQFDNSLIEKIPDQHIENVVSVYIDNADLFPQGEQTLVSFATTQRLHKMIRHLLARFDKNKFPHARFDILNNAIKRATKSLYFIIFELTLWSQEQEETADSFVTLEYRDFSPEQLDILKQSAVERIIYWAKMQRLSEHPMFIEILRAWWQWGNEGECRDYLHSIIKEDAGLLAFLCSILQKPINEAVLTQERSSDWSEYLAEINFFIPYKQLIPHAKRMFEDLDFEKLREREQLGILIFLDLVKVKTLKIIPKTTAD